MRTFLILLIVANIGYLAWWQEWLVERPAPAAALQPAGFRQAEQGLTLLNELPATRLTLMSSLAEARTARQEAAEQLEGVQQEVEAVAGEIDDNQAELAEDQSRSAAVQQQLLETLDAAVAEVAPEESAAAATPWCASTAIFPDQAAAAGFSARLADLGGEAVIEIQETPVSSTWWVHMPAFASEAEARDMLEELQGKGIDSYYMRSGDMAGGISLGVYSREESAGIAQRQLADQGYTSTIREVVRMEERPFARLRLPDGKLREGPEWAAFLAASGPVELTEIACEPIASENEFP